MKKQSSDIRESGFTIIELMVVVIILSILAFFSMPLVGDAIPNMKLKGTARGIYSSLQNAKLAALKENCDAVMSVVTGTYTEQGGVGSYMTFLDNGEGGGTSGDRIRNGQEKVLSSGNMPLGISLFQNTFTGSIGFNGQGLPLRLGSLQVRNEKRWYMINVSIAGTITLMISSDGTNFKL